jgi:hypothetical protein
MHVRFGTWTVRSLYRAVSLKTIARELEKYKLDLVGVQGVRWEKRPLKRQRFIRFSMEKGMKTVRDRYFSYIRQLCQQLGE